MTLLAQPPANSTTPSSSKKIPFKFKQPSKSSPNKVPFKLKENPSNKIKFKLKTTSLSSTVYNHDTQFTEFVNFCISNKLPYFQFYDVDNWRGPATKIDQDDLDAKLQLFDEAQDFLHTIVLNGYGFAIVKPIEHLDDNNIVYKDTYFDACKFTDEPMIPYNSDMDDDDEEEYDETTDEEIVVEEEFLAEEWVYDGVTYLLDTNTNYLYFPSTLEFIGKKTSEFSIDFNAKER